MTQGRIDFESIDAAALNSAEGLLHAWVGGRRNGTEWNAAHTRDGGIGDSLTINLRTGVWLHGASGAAGAGLITLYAYVYSMRNGEAAKAIAEQLGMNPDQPQIVRPAPAVATVQSNDKQDDGKGNWLPIVPVPAHAMPSKPRAHVVRGKPVASYAYTSLDGDLLGFVERFITSDGGKTTIPLTFCKQTTTGEQAWRNVAFVKPRPLYNLHNLKETGAVLIVEGEKCVDFAQADPVLASKCSVVSWMGGVQGSKHADWAPLAGRNIIVWPDCDSHADKSGVILPRLDQPGEKVARQIADALLANGCKVKIVNIPAPAAVPSGWDIADMITGGLTGNDPVTGDALWAWVKDRVQDYTGTPAAAPICTPATAGAGAGHAGFTPDEVDNLANELSSRWVMSSKGAKQDCAHNVFYALTLHPTLRGLVSWDDFRYEVVKTRPAPWGGAAGTWGLLDDRKLNLWLLESLGLLIKSESSITSGVSMAADAQSINPPRTWLNSLAWDGVARVDDWLIRGLGADINEYHRLVGPMMLRGAVNRLLAPGSKFDYCMVLEGKQGKGKSTALRILGGDYFKDAPVQVGKADGSMIIQGAWLYEVAEMDSFNRSESTAVKQFITQQFDEYRVPYDRRMSRKPRQCVFFGTTNTSEYLKDSTGNRRFWPVMCNEVDFDWLTQNRDQLWAEALEQVKQAMPLYPARDEETTLIVPQQEARALQDAWDEVISGWLDQGEQQFTNEFTLTDVLVGALKMPLDRIGASKSESARVGAVMARLGWLRKRQSTGQRLYQYHRPKNTVAPQPGVPF